MNTTTTYVILGLSLLFGWSFFSFIYPLIKEIIRIHITPTEYISELPSEGKVEVVGKTEHKIISSLLTQRECVLWQIVVQELWVSDGQHRGILETILIKPLQHPDWITTHIKTSSETFDIHDETGKIQILPADDVHLILRDNRESSSLFPFDPQIKDILEGLGIETTNYLGNDKPLRVYEHIIEPAEEIYILSEIKYENGVKTIGAEEGAQQIISDHSQRELLFKLYRDALARIFLFASIALTFFSVLNSK